MGASGSDFNWLGLATIRRRHKITFKKSLRVAEQERADVARARRRWMREQGMFDPARLVFVDETAANTKMVRLSGRCPRGERLIGRVPQGHWKTITFVPRSVAMECEPRALLMVQ
jgi:hypothetical protein